MSISKAQIALFAAFMASGAFTVDLFIPALPSFAETFQIGLTQAGSAQSIFFISFAIGQLIVGPISDRIGRRPLVLFGLVLLAISSTIGVITDSYETVLVMRSLQALGACAMTVIARASVADMLGTQDSAKVFALLMLVGGVAPMLTPWLGTVIDNFFGWQGVFILVTVMALIMFLFSFFLLPETHKPKQNFKENTLLSYWKLLSNRRVLFYTLAGAFSGGTLFTFLGAISPILREVYDVEQSAFATVFTIHGAMLVIGSQISRMVLQRISAEEALRFSAITISILGILMVVVGIGFNTGLIPLLIIQCFLALNFATIQGNCLALAIAGDENRAGAAAALFGASGWAMGSLLSSFANSLFNGTNTAYILITMACQIAILICVLCANRIKRHETLR